MTTFEIFTLLFAALQFLAIMAIAIIAYLQTEKLKKYEHTQQIATTYNTLNVAALSSDENLLAFDSIGRTDVNEDISTRRKRWAGFVWLATLQNVFLISKYGMLGEAYRDKTLKEQLTIILKDNVIWDILNHRGFHSAFIAYCKPIRSKSLQRIQTETD